MYTKIDKVPLGLNKAGCSQGAWSPASSRGRPSLGELRFPSAGSLLRNSPSKHCDVHGDPAFGTDFVLVIGIPCCNTGAAAVTPSPWQHCLVGLEHQLDEMVCDSAHRNYVTDVDCSNFFKRWCWEPSTTIGTLNHSFTCNVPFFPSPSTEGVVCLRSSSGLAQEFSK